MHIAIFTDLHPMSLGGLQTSVRLQRKYLERAGVEVTIFSPKSSKGTSDDHIVILPSRNLSPDGEYATMFNIPKALGVARKEFQERRIDLIHVQGDFGAASIGLRLAKEFDVPIIHHAHTNIDVVLERLIGKRLNARLFNYAARLYTRNALLPERKVTNGWQYMATTYPNADLVMVPSFHFAQTLKEQGIAKDVTVMPNGVDDDAIEGISRKTRIPNSPPVLIWAGRFLREKRLIQTIRAFSKADVDARLVIYGTGALEQPAKSLVRTLRLGSKVKFYGKVERFEMMQAFADADVTLQTSVGFETQGMTVFEAAAFGTPSLCCDERVAGELRGNAGWIDRDGTVESLAQVIGEAVQDISSGKLKRTDDQDNSWLRQSKLTQEMIRIYQQLIDAKKK